MREKGRGREKRAREEGRERKREGLYLSLLWTTLEKVSLLFLDPSIVCSVCWGAEGTWLVTSS